MQNRIAASLSRWSILLVTACGARAVELDGQASDGGSINPNSIPDAIAPGVSAFAENQENAMRIAVDEERVYWLSTIPGSWAADRPRSASVRSCAKSDCRSTMITYDSATTSIDAPLPPPQFHALVAHGGHLYWAHTKPTQGMAISTCASTGCLGVPRTIAVDVSVSSMSLAADDSHVYWTSARDTAILRAAVSGSDRTEIVAANELDAEAITVDDTHVYWIAGARKANASVRRVSKRGGEAPTTLVSGQNQAASLAVDANFFYWANGFSVGSISRCPLTGCNGAPETLIADQNRPTALATDGTFLYWMNLVASSAAYPTQASVHRCPIDACGAALQTLAVQVFAYDGMSMALDARDVYWVAQGYEDSSGGQFYPQATIYRHPK